MGIQSSVNRLTGQVVGSLATAAVGFKKIKEKKAEKPKQKKPEETSEVGNRGNIVKIGRVKRNPYKVALDSANAYISEKAIGKTFSVEDRVKQAQEATSLSIVKQKEDNE